MSDSIVTAEDVYKDFGEEGVLHGMDLEINRNETTLLMGPNGTGKTVFMACVAGGLIPSTGTIEVFGKRPHDAREELSFMLQGGLGLSDLSGRENIEFYGDLHPRATEDWRHIVEEMGLEDELDRPVRDYSGGMLRKLELAISLSVDVPLYLLDEPSSELDLTTINQFHSLIREKQENGHTVVLTSHTPLDAEIADRIVIVQHGRVVTDGAPDDLLAAVPPVVTVEGTRDVDEVLEFLQDRRLFQSGQNRRGFLREDVSSDRLESETDARVRIHEPGYSDMFNYYTQVVPDET